MYIHAALRMRTRRIHDVMCYVAKNIQRDIGKRGHPELHRPRSWRSAIYLAVFVAVLSIQRVISEQSSRNYRQRKNY